MKYLGEVHRWGISEMMWHFLWRYVKMWYVIRLCEDCHKLEKPAKQDEQEELRTLFQWQPRLANANRPHILTLTCGVDGGLWTQCSCQQSCVRQVALGPRPILWPTELQGHCRCLRCFCDGIRKFLGDSNSTGPAALLFVSKRLHYIITRFNLLQK